MIIQRGEMKKLYNRFSKSDLDEWVNENINQQFLVVELFSPMLKFEEMTDTMLGWFKQNGHHLYFDDNDEFRTIVCANSDMGP